MDQSIHLPKILLLNIWDFWGLKPKHVVPGPQETCNHLIKQNVFRPSLRIAEVLMISAMLNGPDSRFLWGSRQTLICASLRKSKRKFNIFHIHYANISILKEKKRGIRTNARLKISKLLHRMKHAHALPLVQFPMQSLLPMEASRAESLAFIVHITVAFRIFWALTRIFHYA